MHNLLFLLTYSPRDPWRPQTVTAAEAQDLLPALAELLARTARRTLEAGVLHGYRTIEEDLPLVRGRIRTADQMRRTGLPLFVAVRYDDHTPDIAENRILLAALHRAARLPGVSPRTATALRHLADRLSGVHLLPTGAPLPSWTPTRLNARYAPLLRLAELLLAGRSVQTEGAHATAVDGFVLDMPAVFERFLTLALSDALARHGVRCAAQEQHHRLDTRGLVRMRPDLVLYRAGRPQPGAVSRSQLGQRHVVAYTGSSSAAPPVPSRPTTFPRSPRGPASQDGGEPGGNIGNVVLMATVRSGNRISTTVRRWWCGIVPLGHDLSDLVRIEGILLPNSPRQGWKWRDGPRTAHGTRKMASAF
ncbi:McrC family protein [Streptomyces carpinensis]|uniref:McrC family protein n=1 Tax=Streptomyces carpinensis TaxID=66369 RepID=A0ABV1W8F2_9ACTN|nr:McrC family protein [Streptomyces carpinensis]